MCTVTAIFAVCGTSTDERAEGEKEEEEEEELEEEGREDVAAEADADEVDDVNGGSQMNARSRPASSEIVTATTQKTHNAGVVFEELIERVLISSPFQHLP